MSLKFGTSEFPNFRTSYVAAPQKYSNKFGISFGLHYL